MTRFGARRLAVLAALLFLVSVYCFSQWRDLERGLHGDEVEHLHATVLVERGLRPYVDFFEHHPPLFWAMLRPLVPEGTGTAAMQLFATRARLLSGATTALAIVSAAFVVWRASGNPWTAVTFIGIVFAAGGVWRNGLGDIRPDATALGVWWAGAALVLLARRPWVRGAGLGLVFLASLIKPQWPLSSIVIGVVFLISVAYERRAFFTAVAAALAVAAVGLGATAMLADLRAIYFHVVVLTRDLIAVAFLESERLYPALFGCPPLLRPLGIAVAAAIVVFALLRARAAFAAPRLIVTLLLIAAATLCEIFFVYPYPAVHFRFYAFWSLSGAAVLALLPQSAAALMPWERLRNAIQFGAAGLALLISVGIVAAPRPQPDRYWRYAAWLEKHLRPGDTVWNDGSPIDARDASYYWFQIENEVIPVAMRAAQGKGRPYLPSLVEEDLPPCRVERGLDTNVRLMTAPNRDLLPVAAACFARLQQRGVVEQGGAYRQVWIVRR